MLAPESDTLLISPTRSEIASPHIFRTWGTVYY